MVDIEELRALIAFLKGEASFDGKHFGERNRNGHAFWWRKDLRAIDGALDEIEALRHFERKAAEITVQPISDSHKVERIYELIAERNSN